MKWRDLLMAAARGAGGAAAFSPTQLAGLKLWHAPRLLALNDADPISTNTDYSGNGWNATGVTTTRPLFKTNIVNGLAIARYDGTDDIMDVASGALGITNNVDSCTLVTVASTTTVSAGARTLLFLATPTATTVRTSIEINRTAAKMGIRGRRLDADGTVQIDGASSLSTGTFYIFVVQDNWSTNSHKGYINGGAADASGAFGGSGNTSATDSANIKLGANPTPLFFWSGDIGDQLVYVPALSLANLNLLGAYLGTTYGLTWTTAT